MKINCECVCVDGKLFNLIATKTIQFYVAKQDKGDSKPAQLQLIQMTRNKINAIYAEKRKIESKQKSCKDARSVVAVDADNDVKNYANGV